MARFAVVIPSKTLSNLLPCIKEITRLNSCKEFTLHIVDSGLDTKALWTSISSLAPNCSTWVTAAKLPFVFAQAVNSAVRFSTEEIVIVMNDDALLKTPNGLTMLAEAVKMNPEYGVISAGVTGAACNGHILVPSRPYAPFPNDVLDAGKMVPFICVALSREVFNRVGGLDEQFVDYGFEDDDFCRSVRNLRLKIGVLKSVAVNHEFLPSTYRSSGVRVSLEPNRLRYLKKWGDHEGV